MTNKLVRNECRAGKFICFAFLRIVASNLDIVHERFFASNQDVVVKSDVDHFMKERG